MNYLVNEIDYIAWYPVWKFIDHLNLKLRGTKYSESLKVRYLNIIYYNNEFTFICFFFCFFFHRIIFQN